MIQKIRKYVTDENVGIREKLFRIILIIGDIMSVLTFLSGMTMQNFGQNMIPLLLTVAVMCLASVLTIKYDKADMAVLLIGVIGFCGLLPYMFFINGGPYSGVPIWYVLGILYMFLMFEGRKLIFFVSLEIIVDVMTYYIAYNNSEMLSFFESELELYQDSLFAVLIVAVPVGIFIRFQTKQLEKEQARVLLQKEEHEKLNKSKDAFFSNMSHEIKIPINTIMGLNEVILRDNISDEVAENARSIKNAAGTLLSIVNDVLDYSGLENGNIELMPVNYSPKSMFSELVKLSMACIQEKKLQFIVDIDETLPQTLKGDDRRIKQAVLNILINAVNYTDAGTITLSAWGRKNDNGRLLLKILVTDTGTGIKQEEMESIYDSFKMSDKKETGKSEVNRLGLAISKQLVDLMGGEIKADSIYMKGSEFTVTIEQDIIDEVPIGPYDFMAAANGDEEGKRYRQSFEAPGAKLLVVDYDDSSLLVVAKLLEATKLEIDVAKSGEDCLNKTLEKAYNIVILSNMLPDMNGRALLKKLRVQENGLCKNVPVLLLSTSVTENNRQDYIEQGFDGCLAKPVDSLELETEILNLLPRELVEYRLDYKSVQTDKDAARMRRHRLKKIVVTSDCICDLPNDLLEQYDIKIIYFYIETATGNFQDTKELDIDNIAGLLENRESMLRPVCAGVEEFEQFYADILTEAVDVIHISAARHVGAAYDNAVMAAKGFAHVHVIDSGSISGGQGIMVLYAAKMVQEGFSADEVRAELLKIRGRIETGFLIPSVNLFYNSGFSNILSAKLCDLLKAHPVVRLKQSQMKLLGVRFGEIEAARRHFIYFRLKSKKNIDPGVLIISHVCLSVKEQKELIKEINRNMKFDKIIVQKASVTDACCSGIGTIGVSYLLSEK